MTTAYLFFISSTFKEIYFRTGQVLTPTDLAEKQFLILVNTYVMAVYSMDLELDKTPEAVYEAAIERSAN